MARGRSRHGARPPRHRWWYAGAAALATAATLLIAYTVWSPSGADGTPAADRQVVVGGPTASASPSRAPGTSPSPSVSPHRSPSPSAKASASARSGSKAKKDGSEAGGGAGTSAQQPSTAPAGKRLITVVNRTQKTVWAVVTGTSAYPEGRKLAPGQNTSVTVANNWNGRVWGRTGCTSTAASVCASGDCTTVCSGPKTPTTLGEFALDVYAGMDFYDVSMVDGSNLPMYINISHTTTTDPVSPTGCYKGVCTTDIDCPSRMQAVAGGQVVGCKPPCEAFGGDTYCCLDKWAGRENCVPSKWPVDYTQVFKKAAPYAYSYAFDDAATMPCKGACYYRVTFGTTG